MSADRDDRVADFVLGLMDSDEAERFEHAMSRNADLASSVTAAFERFGPLDDTAPAVAPDHHLWQRINSLILRPQATAVRHVEKPSALWNSLRLWRGLALGGLATAGGLAAVLAVLVTQPAPAPQFVAVLIPADNGAAGAIVEVDTGGRARLTPLQDIPVPQGRALQVWSLQTPEQGPVSIGLLDHARSADLALGPLAPTKPEQLFEITLEPASGSPTGRPTGPILFKGLTQKTL